MPINHAFTSPKSDGGDDTLVRPSDWNADHTGDTFDLSVRSIVREEFFSATAPYDGGFAQTTSGGSIASDATDPDGSHPGVLSLSTGSTTTGRAGIVSANFTCMQLGGGEARGVVIAKIQTLSDGTDTFSVRTGFGSSFTADGTDGAFFRYTDSVNGGKWEAVCRNSNTETATDTGITADTNWHRFEVVVNAAGTSVDFLIHGTVEATVTTNIPTARIGAIAANIIKSAGTTARQVKLDAYAYIFEFTTPR